MSENLPSVVPTGAVAGPQSFFEMEPRDQVAHAVKIADVLCDIIDKQKLYTSIQGKNYVKVEGWQTLGTFLGILPRERSVTRLDDGSYEAFVDLIKSSNGTVIGGGSALCSINEKRWGGAEDYARRSMAITRATGKAFRSAFSWIINLAGYEATPAEEMPHEPIEPKVAAKTSEIYEGRDEQKVKLRSFCEKEGHDFSRVEKELMGKIYNKLNVGMAVTKAMAQ